MIEYRPMPVEYKQEMMRLQAEMLSLLPDKRWYFPSEEWEFDEWLAHSHMLGAFDGDRLCGYAAMAPATVRGDHSYARILGKDSTDTYDFHDVVVAGAYRRQGIHSEFLRRFTEMSRAAGGRAIYCTVDPENLPSRASFEKAGYVFQEIRNAYDGRPRCYYELKL